MSSAPVGREMGGVSFPCGEVKGLARGSDPHADLPFDAYRGEMQDRQLDSHAPTGSHCILHPSFLGACLQSGRSVWLLGHALSFFVLQIRSCSLHLDSSRKKSSRWAWG